jgi:hypothetical protein
MTEFTEIVPTKGQQAHPEMAIYSQKVSVLALSTDTAWL